MMLPRYDGYVPLPGPEGRKASVQTGDLEGLNALTQSTMGLLEMGGKIHQGRARVQAEAGLLELGNRANAFIEDLNKNQDPEDWDDMFQQFRNNSVSEIFPTIRNSLGQRMFNEASESELEKMRHGVALQRIHKEQELGTQQTMTIAEEHVKAGRFQDAMDTVLHGINEGWFNRAQGTALFVEVQKRAYHRHMVSEAEFLYKEFGLNETMNILNDESRFTEMMTDVFPTGDGQMIPQGSTIPLAGPEMRNQVKEHIQNIHDDRMEVEKQGRAAHIDQLNNGMSQLWAMDGITSGAMRSALNDDRFKALKDTRFETSGPVYEKWIRIMHALESAEKADGRAADTTAARLYLADLQLEIITSPGDQQSIHDLHSKYIEDMNNHPGYFTADEIRKYSDLIQNIAPNALTKAMGEVIENNSGIFGAQGNRSDEQIQLLREANEMIKVYSQRVVNGEIPYDLSRGIDFMENFLKAPQIDNVARRADSLYFGQSFGRGIFTKDEIEKAQDDIQNGRYQDGLWTHPRFRDGVDQANIAILTAYARHTGRDPIQMRQAYAEGKVGLFPSTGQMYLLEGSGDRPVFRTFRYESLGAGRHDMVIYDYVEDGNPMDQYEINWDDWIPSRLNEVVR